MGEQKKTYVYNILSKIDVTPYIEEKNGFLYLNWAWAWYCVKTHFPDTEPPKFKCFPEMVLNNTPEGFVCTDRKVPYLTTPSGTMVECSIVIEGEEYTESLYVMDNNNNYIINPNMAMINTAQKRCMVKCLALAGLGLNLYAGTKVVFDNPEVVSSAKPANVRSAENVAYTNISNAQKSINNTNQQRENKAVQNAYARLDYYWNTLVQQVDNNQKEIEKIKQQFKKQISTDPDYLFASEVEQLNYKADLIKTITDSKSN